MAEEMLSRHLGHFFNTTRVLLEHLVILKVGPTNKICPNHSLMLITAFLAVIFVCKGNSFNQLPILLVGAFKTLSVNSIAFSELRQPKAGC